MRTASLLILCWLMLGCTHDPIIPQEPEIRFSDQIFPIIISNCATEGCHTQVADGEELIPLTNYDQVRNEVKPGNAPCINSLLLSDTRPYDFTKGLWLP